MAINTSEKTFESEIEYSLITYGGYQKREPSHFDAAFAIDKEAILHFIQTTQPKAWEKLCSRHKGQNVGKCLIKRLADELRHRGTLDVLRHGIKDLGVEVLLCYFKPGNKLNKTTFENYHKNCLSVMRQVHHSSRKPMDSVDTVLLLNGLPFATLELKNPITSQTYQNAINQYKNDRSPRDTLFSFKRGALVHFAVDSEQVYMTTELKGKNTYFLPFNKGDNGGGGNPANPNGYRTAYLWEEVLSRDSILDIIERFMHLSVEKDKNGKNKEKLIFPRYHQLDVVRKLVADAKANGSGKNYLIQHSAGSGKSNSIAWLAHHLSTLHSDNNEVIFNSIIVITDRRILDRQLQENIDEFEHVDGVVVRIEENKPKSKSKQLSDAINKGGKIIITTLQTFPFILDLVNDITGKRFAVIVDEAHSSQTGKASEKLREVLADIDSKDNEAIEEKLHQYALEEEKIENETPDSEDEIVKEMASHGQQPNLSFFAFTATPKPKTIEIFGTKGEDGLPHAFHVYSMRQAIDEKFILNVLDNYTTYQTYFQIGKKIVEDPVLGKTKANKALGKFLSLHPYNLAQKTEIMIEHFRSVTRYKIGGQAKAMLVTGSRLHAVRYYFEFKKYIKKMHYTDLGVLVAFSGKIKDDGTEYTEVGLNEFPESELPEKFESGEYQLLIVAEKYQTGFDQPLLHTMYVDKKLSGVKAVQTLSRLNRMYPGKEDTFVLDFANTKEDILSAFQPYYQCTEIDDVTDPNLIYDIKHTLDGYHIYSKLEIENFAKVFFKSSKKQSAFDFSKVNRFLDPAVDRFNNLDSEEKKKEFKASLRKFTRLYSFICHIIRLEDSELHKFNAYAKCLLRKLPAENQGATPNLENDVSLQYYRIQKIFESNIDLEKKDGELPGGRHGTGVPKEEDTTLSQAIAKVNERFGTNFTEMDKVIEQFIEDMANNDEMKLRANNPMDLFKIAYNNNIMDVVINRLNQNQEFCTKYIEDDDFRSEIDRIVLPCVYEKLTQIGNWA